MINGNYRKKTVNLRLIMIKNTPTHYGLLLAVITLVLFFAVYLFFSGFNYYSVTVNMNAFVLPAIYTLAVIILLYKKTNKEKLSFADSFKNSFLTLFIGGTVSFLAIAFFLNYVDEGAQTLLQHQRIEQNLQSVHADYKEIIEPSQEETQQYQEIVKYMQSDAAKDEPLFSLKKSFIILGILYSFYLVISLFLSIFFRTRNPYATLPSNPPS